MIEYTHKLIAKMKNVSADADNNMKELNSEKIDMGTDYDIRVEEIRGALNLTDEYEFKETIYALSDVVGDVLKKTLGPYAHTTIISDGVYSYPTKDGWAVLSRMNFNDPLLNTLFTFIRNISFTINSAVGDGTTTAIIAADAYIRQLRDDTSLASVRQADFLDVMTKMKDRVIERLKSPAYCMDIKSKSKDEMLSKIFNIAYTSSNGNEHLSTIIQKIYSETDNPSIYVELSPERETIYEIAEGYKLDCKLLGAKFYYNSDNKAYENRGDALVAIFDHNVTYLDHMPILQYLTDKANRMGRDIIIFAPYYDEIITNIMKVQIDNVVAKGQIPALLMVQVPLSTATQRTYLSDFGTVGCMPIIDSSKVKLYNKLRNSANNTDAVKDDPSLNSLLEMYSTAEEIIEKSVAISPSIILNDKYCILRDFDIENPTYKNLIETVREEYMDAKDQQSLSTDTVSSKDYRGAYTRYVRLYGKMGTIKVGGDSELEKHCLKDAVDDSVLACRSAYENGYVIGLNISTISAIHDVMNELEESHSIEYKALSCLLSMFVDTSKAVIMNKIDDEDAALEIITKCFENRSGYDLKSNTYQTFEDCTIINSVKTDIEILNAVTSILSLILTSNQFLSLNKLYDKKLTRKKAGEDKYEEARIIASAVIDVIKEKKLLL